MTSAPSASATIQLNRWSSTCFDSRVCIRRNGSTKSISAPAMFTTRISSRLMGVMDISLSRLRKGRNLLRLHIFSIYNYSMSV